ncbi:HAD family hydrolase [Massilia sp. S19_KUP03_FR1]|uniref:HAD family hydrolase n=1 Tax=Massilia sp. S19_KUP03_FR1 TaxID=3025503 RepID=UPI002FCD7028
MTTPHAVLFDLDDTLWPIGPVIARAEELVQAWLAQHAPGVAQRFSIEALRSARMALLQEQPDFHLDFGALRRAGLHAAFAEAGEDASGVEHAMQVYYKARNTIELYEDVLPALQEIGALAVVGSISNGNADLQTIGLAQHFSFSLSAGAHGSAKPDPGIFLAACAAMGVAPQDAVYVGDDILLDVQGAQRAGLRAVWLNRTGSTRHLEHGVVPDAICRDFTELLEWLRGQRA